VSYPPSTFSWHVLFSHFPRSLPPQPPIGNDLDLPFNSPLHRLIPHQQRHDDVQYLASGPSECVEDGSGGSAGERVLAVGGNGVGDDAFLGGGAWGAECQSYGWRTGWRTKSPGVRGEQYQSRPSCRGIGRVSVDGVSSGQRIRGFAYRSGHALGPPERRIWEGRILSSVGVRVVSELCVRCVS